MVRSDASLKAVILVGGHGTRLQPLTYEIPKPMLPLVNRPFLEHTIAYLQQYGISSIVLAMSYLPDVIQKHFGHGHRQGVELSYALEATPLGTAGAVKNTEQQLDSTFVVLNGDIFTEVDLADMLGYHRRKGAKATIAMSWVDNPCAFGVIETEGEGRVRRFIEKPKADEVTTNWINAGIYILEPDVLEYVPANTHHMFEKGLFPLLLDMGEPFYGYPFRGYWLDMGTPEKYLRLNCDLLLSQVNSPLLGDLDPAGVCCEPDVTLHSSADIAGPVVIGSRCRIDGRASIKGPVVIGPDCCISEGARVEGTVVWSGVNVGTGAELKQCIVGSNTSIKDNAHMINDVVTADGIS